MYNISLKNDKPDIKYLESEVRKSMELGIKIAECNSMIDEFSAKKDEILNKIREDYRIDNPNSVKQLSTFLEGLAARVDITSKNDIVEACYNNGKWTTNADALETLANNGYEFASDILEYRHYKKYCETLESLKGFMDSDGFVKPMVSLSKTNRIQYSKPGLLTIPKELLWKLVTSRSENTTLYSVDIKNQEPGILINVTNSTELKTALASPEGLYETMMRQCFQPVATANIVVEVLPEPRRYSTKELRQNVSVSPAFYTSTRVQYNDTYFNDKKIVGIETVCMGGSIGDTVVLPETIRLETETGDILETTVEWEDNNITISKNKNIKVSGRINGTKINIGSTERKEFKTAWNAISYGASMYGIQKMCKKIDGKRVYEYIAKVNGLSEYRKAIDKRAKSGIQTIYTAFGTPLDAGGIYEYNSLKRSLLDLPIQGTGADILSLLIKHLNEYIENNAKGLMKLYFTRHDEVIVEIDNSYINEKGNEGIIEILKDIFTHKVDDWEPFRVTIERLGSD